jgi:hypothetical protein
MWGAWGKFVDQVQGAAGPVARPLGKACWDHAIVPAPHERRRNRDAPQLGVGNLPRAGLDQLSQRPLDVRDGRSGQPVAAKRLEPPRIALAGPVQIEKRVAIEAPRVSVRRPEREADRDNP